MEKKSVIVAFVVLSLIAIAGAGSGIYYWQQYQAALQRAKDPTIESKELLAQLGKLIDLPDDEDPTIATITNIEQIRNQPFFAKGKNGDRVILYTNGRMAILFDDKANKIINVGSINVNTATPSATPNPTESTLAE